MEITVNKRIEFILHELQKIRDHPGENQFGGLKSPLLMPFEIPDKSEKTVELFWPTHSNLMKMKIIPVGDETLLELQPRGRLVDQGLYEEIENFIKSLWYSNENLLVDHIKGEPPRTSREKAEAWLAWQRIPDADRPLLIDWLGELFGYRTDGSPYVPDSTFNSWKDLAKKFCPDRYEFVKDDS